MTRTIILIIFIILIAISWAELFFLFKEDNKLKASLLEITQKAQVLSEENQSLKAQIDYYSDPANLEKELKSRYNYRRPDEKMMIIVP
ncbi:MAG: septum formation initiator family protein [Candidatus Wolfebacteria bacterium]|nr:septum formation initiator family protein [Candidatus Wolfebacteria bacterium]